ncbi:MAG: hypothetical protein KBD78_02110, partial [Oligoflexales bacterium]|nr:hypothetical protein [Oligoflexales bacterium]
IQEWHAGNSQLTSSDQHPVSNEGGRSLYANWGTKNQSLTLSEVKVPQSGWYFIQALYNNMGPISTGITATTKFVDIILQNKKEVLSTQALVMPHLIHYTTWEHSTLAPIYLESDKIYQFVLRDHMNMSYLQHFASYRGRGGEGGIDNRTNIGALKLLYYGSHEPNK